ncbi:MAG: 6-bladed beta-propeller [Tannerella sp.]|jgi:hypothetical protein|nr:6-bladed beta-propeller [Tannerella sp.]
MKTGNIQSITVLFAFMLVCSTCKNETVRAPLNIETETIDFSSFKRIETGNIPESIIKNVSYVKLDGSFDDVLFKNINILKIANNRIFILDVRLRKLVVFDSTGAGLGKVGNQGQGPEDYLRIHDFCVSDDGNIYFLDGSGGNHRLFAFDRDFKFVSVKKLPFNMDHIHPLVNDRFIFALSSWNKGNNASNKIVITDDQFKTEEAYLQFDEYVDENMVIGISTFTCFEDRILYHKTIDNFVYEFSNEGKPLKAYFFDFGSRDVPKNERKNIEENWENFKRYSCLSNIVLINDKYMAGILFDERTGKSFIVDRIENCLYILNQREKRTDAILWCYENTLVSYIYPGMYEDIQSVDLPQDVKDHIENGDFVLCLYELK